MLNRGEIYFVNLNPTKGREQAGSRPVLIVSSDAINHQPLVVAVVVGTSGKNVSRDYPSNVRVSAKESGLREETVFLCFQVRSLDPARFVDPEFSKPMRAGFLPEPRMKEIDQALRLVFSL